MTRSFTLVTEARAAPEVLFAASLDIDRHVASMAQSRERAIGGVTSGSIGLGEHVTWRARHFGVWFTMTSRITELEAPLRFVDEQIAGPFRRFRHEHVFEPMVSSAGAGVAAESRGSAGVGADSAPGIGERVGTRMVDTITLASPVFGRLGEDAVLVPYLRGLIAQRNAALLESL